MKLNSQSEILRESRQKVNFFCIGDLDGNFENFRNSLLEQRLVNNNLDWIGGDKKVVFSGDILADIGNDGFKILLEINRIRRQANMQGGDISVLAGNHEEFMLGYLAGNSVNLGGGEIPELLKSMDMGNGINKANGLRELLKYGKNRTQILQNMRDSEQGRIILEEMYNFKLVEIVGDSIHFHTPPNKKMLEILRGTDIHADIDTAVKRLNNKWKECLGGILLGYLPSGIYVDKSLLDSIKGFFTEDEFSKKSNDTYHSLAKAFLNTSNDTRNGILNRLGNNPGYITNFTDYIAVEDPREYGFLLYNGIKTVVYGHTDSQLIVNGINFIGTNHNSVEVNKPLKETKNPTKEELTQEELNKIEMIKSLGKAFDNINIQWILNLLDEDYSSYKNAGYKMAFVSRNNELRDFLANPKLQELLKEITRGILQIKSTSQGLALRVGFEYWVNDFGTPKSLDNNIPKNISDFIDQVMIIMTRKSIV